MATQVALVTASSAGLGAAIAQALAPHFRVVVNYRSRPEKAAELIQASEAIAPLYALEPGQPRFHAVQGDVAERADIQRLVQETVTTMGRLDVVISNAGWTRITNFFNLEEQVVEDDWDRCFAVNVKAHLWLLHAAKPHLQRYGGAASFITIASLAGVRPSGSSVAYAVTKAAAIHLTKSLALVCGKTVRCNSVSPGMLMTEWGQRFTKEQVQATKDKAALVALPRLEDVADQVKSLALSQSITGQNIIVDLSSAIVITPRSELNKDKRVVPCKNRKRATRACLYCRGRKVRCDVSQRGQPCMSCYLDNKTCIVRDRASKNRHLQYEIVPIVPAPNISYIRSTDNRTEPGEVVYIYYPFLAFGNSPNMTPQEVSFLNEESCLRIPEPELLDVFLQQYFRYVHPMMPVVHEGAFWEAYSPTGEHVTIEPVSFLVLRAMLFAACDFVPTSTLKAFGYASVQSVRAILYRRAKLLYDLECETSPLAAAQACLLLSFGLPLCTVHANVPWLDRAIQHARWADAHDFAHVSNMHASSRFQRTMLKRVWWCCLLRDRSMGLLVRRPLLIPQMPLDCAFDETARMGVADLADEFDCSRVYNHATKRHLAEILAHIVALCVLLTDILMLVFPMDESFSCSRHQTKFDDATTMRECRRLLHRWYKDATLCFQDVTSKPASQTDAEQHHSPNIVVMYTNLMYMYYHTIHIVLCHHTLLSLDMLHAAPRGVNSASVDRVVLQESRHELQSATLGVTQCLQALAPRQLTRWLPLSAMTCVALPLVLHILDMQMAHKTASTDAHEMTNTNTVSEDATTSKQHRLNILIAVVHTSDHQSGGVQWISDIVRHTVNLAQQDRCIFHQTGPCPGINDWTDIVVSHPASYLRLALTLDLSLRKYRLAQDTDLPNVLRSTQTEVNSPPTSQSRSQHKRDGILFAKSGDPGSGHY